ncbi:MAG: signal recognition particle receptor subunit alpha, partial [Acidimicrobiales bacterium]
MTVVIVLAVLALVAVLILGGIGLVATRSTRSTRYRRGTELEPPPPSPPDTTSGRPAAPVDDDLVTQVEEALAGVHDEASRGGAAVEAPPPARAVRPSFRDRLAKARGTFGGYLGSIRSRRVDDATWGELEEALIRADVGVAATQRVL